MILARGTEFHPKLQFTGGFHRNCHFWSFPQWKWRKPCAIPWQRGKLTAGLLPKGMRGSETYQQFNMRRSLGSLVFQVSREPARGMMAMNPCATKTSVNKPLMLLGKFWCSRRCSLLHPFASGTTATRRRAPALLGAKAVSGPS